jgi:photosystem II stability/assembly factor-like uncharacterized protein
MTKPYRTIAIGLLAAAISSQYSWAQEEPAPAATAAPNYVMLPALPNSKPAKAVLLDASNTGERIVAVGARGLIAYSDDDAQTWQQASVPVSLTLTSVFFANPKLGWATGHEGVVLVTKDAGETWEIQLTGEQILEQSLPKLEAEIERLQAEAAANEDPELEQDLGYAVEDAEAALDDAKMTLEDGTFNPLLDVWFKNDTEGYVVGAYGTFLRTTDGGNTWEGIGLSLDNPDKMHLNHIASGDDGTIFISGEAGMAFRSGDGGDSWERLDVPYDGSLFGVLTLGDEKVVVHGLRGNVLYSTDNGDNWNVLETNSTSTFIGSTLAEGNVYIVGASGAVLKANPNDASFEKRFHPGRSSLSSVIQLEGDELLLVGTGGIIKLDSFNNLKGEAL